MRKILSIAALFLSGPLLAQTVRQGATAYPPIPNETVTGTTLSTLTKLSGGSAIVAACTDTYGIIGVATSGAGTAGSATVANAGIIPILFDGAPTAGDYVEASPTLCGYAHDYGAVATAKTTQCVGRVASPATSLTGGAYAVLWGQCEGSGGTGGGGGGSGITALTGDVTATGPGVTAATVVKINGGAVPVSKTIVGTNGSGQLVDATGATLANNTTGSAGSVTGLVAGSQITGNISGNANSITGTVAGSKVTGDIAGNSTSINGSITTAQLTGALLAAQEPAHTGDMTNTAGSLVTSVTKTGGVPFALSATTDTTNAANITSGTIPVARLPLGTNAAPGALQCDGISTLCSGGIVSAVGGGGGSGTVTASAQFNDPYYAAAGTGTAVSGDPSAQTLPQGGTVRTSHVIGSLFTSDNPIVDVDAYGYRSNVSSLSVTSNVVTVSANQTYVPGQYIAFSNCTGTVGLAMNTTDFNHPLAILASPAPTTTSFSVAFTIGNATNAQTTCVATPDYGGAYNLAVLSQGYSTYSGGGVYTGKGQCPTAGGDGTCFWPQPYQIRGSNGLHDTWIPAMSQSAAKTYNVHFRPKNNVGMAEPGGKTGVWGAPYYSAQATLKQGSTQIVIGSALQFTVTSPGYLMTTGFYGPFTPTCTTGSGAQFYLHVRVAGTSATSPGFVDPIYAKPAGSGYTGTCTTPTLSCGSGATCPTVTTTIGTIPVNASIGGYGIISDTSLQGKPLSAGGTSPTLIGNCSAGASNVALTTATGGTGLQDGVYWAFADPPGTNTQQAAAVVTISGGAVAAYPATFLVNCGADRRTVVPFTLTQNMLSQEAHLDFSGLPLGSAQTNNYLCAIDKTQGLTVTTPLNIASGSLVRTYTSGTTATVTATGTFPGSYAIGDVITIYDATDSTGGIFTGSYVLTGATTTVLTWLQTNITSLTSTVTSQLVDVTATKPFTITGSRITVGPSAAGSPPVTTITALNSTKCGDGQGQGITLSLPTTGTNTSPTPYAVGLGSTWTTDIVASAEEAVMQFPYNGYGLLNYESNMRAALCEDCEITDDGGITGYTSVLSQTLTGVQGFQAQGYDNFQLIRPYAGFLTGSAFVAGGTYNITNPYWTTDHSHIGAIRDFDISFPYFYYSGSNLTNQSEVVMMPPFADGSAGKDDLNQGTFMGGHYDFAPYSVISFACANPAQMIAAFNIPCERYVRFIGWQSEGGDNSSHFNAPGTNNFAKGGPVISVASANNITFSDGQWATPPFGQPLFDLYHSSIIEFSNMLLNPAGKHVDATVSVTSGSATITYIGTPNNFPTGAFPVDGSFDGIGATIPDSTCGTGSLSGVCYIWFKAQNAVTSKTTATISACYNPLTGVMSTTWCGATNAARTMTAGYGGKYMVNNSLNSVGISIPDNNILQGLTDVNEGVLIGEVQGGSTSTKGIQNDSLGFEFGANGNKGGIVGLGNNSTTVYLGTPGTTGSGQSTTPGPYLLASNPSTAQLALVPQGYDVFQVSSTAVVGNAIWGVTVEPNASVTPSTATSLRSARFGASIDSSTASSACIQVVGDTVLCGLKVDVAGNVTAQNSFIAPSAAIASLTGTSETLTGAAQALNLTLTGGDVATTLPLSINYADAAHAGGALAKIYDLGIAGTGAANVGVYIGTASAIGGAAYVNYTSSGTVNQGTAGFGLSGDNGAFSNIWNGTNFTSRIPDPLTLVSTLNVGGTTTLSGLTTGTITGTAGANFVGTVASPQFILTGSATAAVLLGITDNTVSGTQTEVPIKEYYTNIASGGTISNYLGHAAANGDALTTTFYAGGTAGNGTAGFGVLGAQNAFAVTYGAGAATDALTVPATAVSIAGSTTIGTIGVSSSRTGGGTAVCTTGVVCDQLSGTITLTTGATAITTNGNILTIPLGVTRTNFPSCAVTFEGSAVYLNPTHTTTTTSLSVNVGVNLTISTTYTISYVCGGN